MKCRLHLLINKTSNPPSSRRLVICIVGEAAYIRVCVCVCVFQWCVYVCVCVFQWCVYVCVCVFQWYVYVCVCVCVSVVCVRVGGWDDWLI